MVSPETASISTSHKKMALNTRWIECVFLTAVWVFQFAATDNTNENYDSSDALLNRSCDNFGYQGPSEVSFTSPEQNVTAKCWCDGSTPQTCPTWSILNGLALIDKSSTRSIFEDHACTSTIQFTVASVIHNWKAFIAARCTVPGDARKRSEFELHVAARDYDKDDKSDYFGDENPKKDNVPKRDGEDTEQRNFPPIGGVTDTPELPENSSAKAFWVVYILVAIAGVMLAASFTGVLINQYKRQKRRKRSLRRSPAKRYKTRLEEPLRQNDHLEDGHLQTTRTEDL